MSTQELDRRPPQEAVVTLDSRSAYSDKQIALIARTVAKDALPEELHFFLNVSARYNLDPFQGEIYCSKMRGKNGGEGRIAIIVGEQGRLKIANRYPDYRGFRADVVCENDRFIRKSDPVQVPGAPGCWSSIEHSYSMAGSAAAEGRGAIIGGWCEVYREDRPAVFFFAPLDEYMPQNPSDGEKKHSPWFSTESRMIVKCAISTGFRMAFNLAGIYGEEEIEHIRVQAAAGEVSVEDEIEWGEEEETAEWMRSLFAAANNAKADSYPPAKIRLMLTGLTDEERLALADEQIIPFIVQNEGTVPERGETVVDDADVEVVSEEGGQEGDEPSQAEPIPGV